MTASTAPSPIDTDLLCALFAAGGYWALAPDWVLRGGFAIPTRPLIRRVATGLLIDSVPRIGEER